MFSFCGQSIACCAPDGVRIFDGESRLKSEFLPPSHLKATCSCVCWNLKQTRDERNLRRKRSVSVQDTSAVIGDLLAIGTSTGSILIYSASKAELVGSLGTEHVGQVLSIEWTRNGRLFSGGDDSHVIEWNTSEKKKKFKWKTGDSPVRCIAVTNDGRYLLSADEQIKCWLIDDCSGESLPQCLRTFSGHASPIVALKIFETGHIENSDRRNAKLTNGTAEPEEKNFYFVTAGRNDRLVSAWQMKFNEPKAKNSLQKKPAAIFCLNNSEPSSVTLAPLAPTSNEAYMAVTSTDGKIELFQQRLNGTAKQPVSSKCRWEIVSASEKKSSAILPILAASFLYGFGENSLLCVYDSFARPGFEKLEYLNASDGDIKLVRDSAIGRTRLSFESKSNMINTVISDKHVKYINTDNSSTATATSKKAKLSKNVSQEEMPMEERLKLAIATAKREDDAVASSDPETSAASSLTLLLIQGLHSGDSLIIDNVLESEDQDAVSATVQQLPVLSILPLLRQLTLRIRTKANIRVYIKWLHCILSSHMAYLSTVPEILDELSKHQRFLESRVSLMDNLLRLQGRISLLMNQFSGKSMYNLDLHRLPPAGTVEESESEDEMDYGKLDEESDNWGELDWSDFDEQGTTNGSDDDESEQIKKENLTDSEEESENDEDGDSEDESISDEEYGDGNDLVGDMDDEDEEVTQKVEEVDYKKRGSKKRRSDYMLNELMETG